MGARRGHPLATKEGRRSFNHHLSFGFVARKTRKRMEGGLLVPVVQGVASCAEKKGLIVKSVGSYWKG